MSDKKGLKRKNSFLFYVTRTRIYRFLKEKKNPWLEQELSMILTPVCTFGANINTCLKQILPKMTGVHCKNKKKRQF